MAIDNKLIDQLLADYKKPEGIIGENGLLKNRVLGAELTEHLGYEKHEPAGHHRGNTRNGKSRLEPETVPLFRQKHRSFYQKLFAFLGIVLVFAGVAGVRAGRRVAHEKKLSTFNDYASDGVRQADSPGIQNVALILAGNGVQHKVVTDGAGDYELDDLVPGQYELSVDPATIPHDLPTIGIAGPLVKGQYAGKLIPVPGPP